MSVVHKTVIGILLAVGVLHAQGQPNSLLGNGWGLDHLTVMQRSAEDARQSFAKLGFSVRPGTKFPDVGTENGNIPLLPGSLELMWVYDPAKNESYVRAAGLSAVIEAARRRLQERGGLIQAYNIDVSPIDQAAGFLRGRGMKVSLPPALTVIQDGEAQPGQWQFLAISYEDPKSAPPAGVPGGRGVGFLEYRNNAERLSEDRARQMRESVEREVPDPRRSPGDINANTAKKLESVWVLVSNVEEAVKQSELMGFVPGRERTLAELGARGREVQCGQGEIVFWGVGKKPGPLSAMLQRGELGPFGVSVGVESLDRAHAVAGQGTGKKLRIQKDGGRRRFLVPAEAAGGIWVEFVQQ
jgi:hypothetical protein